MLGAVTLGLAWYAQYVFSWTWQVLAREPLPASAARTFQDRLANGTNAGLMMTWLALPLLSWPLVTGAWIGRSGAASLAALLLVLGIGGGALAALHGVPWLLGWSWTETVRNVGLGLGALGVLAALASWTVGWSRQRRAFTPALVGALVVVVPTLAIGGWAYADYRAWSTLRVDQDLRIAEAYLGRDGQSIWAMVHKGVAYADGKPIGYYRDLPGAVGVYGSQRGTPVQAWRIDLVTHQIDVLNGGREGGLLPPPSTNSTHRVGSPEPLGPFPVMTLRSGSTDWETLDITWYDTASSTPVAQLPIFFRDGRVDALLTAGLREMATQRDAEGNRVWVRDGELEREGAERPPRTRIERVPTYANIPWVPIPGGWVHGVRGGVPAGRNFRSTITTVDGESYDLGQHAGIAHYFLDATTILERKIIKTEGGRRSGLVISDLRTGDELARYESPPWFAPSGIPGRLLRGLSVDGHMVLRLWDPITDQLEPVTWLGPSPDLAPEEQASLFGMQGPGGRQVLHLTAHPPHPRGASTRQVGMAVFDPVAKTARLVLDHCLDVRTYFGLDADDSIVAIEDCRRIVRHGPEVGQREVLFPFSDEGAGR